MKKYTIILLSLILVLSSCSKKRKFEQIKGLDLFDENAAPAGTLGDNDDFYKDAEFQLTAFPVPAVNIQYLYFTNTASKKKDLSIENSQRLL